MIAKLNNWRGSPRKFVKYLRAVQNKKALDVVNKLKFVVSPYAEALRKLLLSAISNAANDPKINLDNLIVKEASVGRGPFLKRVTYRGRGRVGRVTKPLSNVYVLLKEGNNG
ncbi:uL22 family ribosomal protein [Alphaproteobacteria bacterium endosymbiont of Tiliacea citrago]|uniref:uL22m family ribosomal protein n=1 Tax=Alphaproteobacteria bacterium endosymbiont of Tiliacea citrago TaxID=3077944 RepID=UPI00313CF6A6